MLMSMTVNKNYMIDASDFLLIDGRYGQRTKISALFIIPRGGTGNQVALHFILTGNFQLHIP
jgi:hypothetical protein